MAKSNKTTDIGKAQQEAAQAVAKSYDEGLITLSQYDTILDKILDILDLVVSSAEDNNDKNLGCILVLHAISEISRECIESNPWLA